MRRPRTERATGGFTLLEALVVIVVFFIVAVIGFPALQRMIHRSHLEGTTRQAAMLLQSARFEAIKRGVPAGIKADFNDDRVFSFVDLDLDGTFDPANDQEIGQSVPLPQRVSFWGPPDGAPEGPNAAVGFDEDASGAWVVFRTDGSVPAAGAMRFGDVRGNYLEIRVDPPATARVEVRKWDGAAWNAPGEGGTPWEWNT